MLNEISWLSVRNKVKRYPRVRNFSFSYLLTSPVFPSCLISTERNKTAYIWCRKNHGTHSMPTALAMSCPTDSQPPTEGRELHNRKECRLLGIIITTASASCVRSLSHFVLFLHTGHTHFFLFKLLIFTRTFFLKGEWICVIYLCVALRIWEGDYMCIGQVCMLRSEDNLWDSVLFFSHVGSGYQSQIIICRHL